MRSVQRFQGVTPHTLDLQRAVGGKLGAGVVTDMQEERRRERESDQARGQRKETQGLAFFKVVGERCVPHRRIYINSVIMVL